MSVSAPMPFTMRPPFGEAHLHLALRVGAFGHVVHRVEQQLRAALHHALDRLEGRVHRPAAARLGAVLLAVLGDHHARERLLAGLGVRGERRPACSAPTSGVTASSDISAWMSSSKISRFLSASSLKRAKAAFSCSSDCERDAELLQARLEGAAPGELAQREAVRAPAHVGGLHDLVGLAVLEHAVLVDAGFVREGVGADDRLVGLHRIAGDRGDELARRHDLRRVDAASCTRRGPSASSPPSRSPRARRCPRARPGR